MRRSHFSAAATTIAVVSVASALVSGLPASGAVITCPTPAADPRPLANSQDINGDAEARPDPVVGLPSWGTGAFQVRLEDGGALLLSEVFFNLPDVNGSPDRFGNAVAFAQLDDNVCADLAIGSPGIEDGRGGVVIARGSTDGITSDSPVIRLLGQTVGERFGTSVASFLDNVFVGAPDRTVNGHLHAGAIDWYRATSPNQLTFVRSITQDSPGVPGIAESGDRFGRVLASDGQSLRLMVGDPDEAIGSVAAAGTVTSIGVVGNALGSAELFSRNTPGVYGVPQDGDRFGYALDADRNGEHVGVPGAKVGSSDGAGAVYTIAHFASGWRLSQVFTQSSPNVPGIAEPGDHFGAALAAGGFTSCGSGPADPSERNLAIGSPGEDFGSRADVGTVTVVNTQVATASASCGRAYFQGSRGGLGGLAEAGDQLGAALARVSGSVHKATAQQDPDGLQIGVPGEDAGPSIDAGGVVLASWAPAMSLVSAASYGSGVIARRFGSVLGHGVG